MKIAPSNGNLVSRSLGVTKNWLTDGLGRQVAFERLVATRRIVKAVQQGHIKIKRTW